MRKLIVIFLVLFAVQATAQSRFPSLDSLRRYINRYITNSAINAFTDYRLNTALNGMLLYIDSAGSGGSSGGVDSIYAFTDSSFKWRKGLSLYTVTVKGGADVDSMWKDGDSVRYTINGRAHAIAAGTPPETLQQVINNGNAISEPDSIKASDGNTVTLFGGPSSTWQTKMVSTTSQTENRFTPDIIVTRLRNLSTGNYKGYSITSGANTGISVFDQQDLTGLSYENDYHVNGIANKGNRWIPDWGALKQAIHDTAITIMPVLQATQVGYGNGSNILTGEAAFNYNATTNTVTTDSTALLKSLQDTARFRIKTIIPNGDSLKTFGTSITEGSNASPLGDSAYAPLTSAYFGRPLTNYGQSGSGAQQGAYMHLQNIHPHHNNVVTVEIAYNSVRQGGTNGKTHLKIVNAHKAIFVNNYINTWVPAGDASVDHYGTWTTAWDASASGGKSVATGAYTFHANDSIAWNFSGNNVAFSIFGGDGSGGVFSPSAIDVYIDNILVETCDPNNQTDGISDLFNSPMDGKLIPYSKYYTGLSDGSHRIKIVNKTLAYLLFDYFATLIDPLDAKTLVFIHPIYSNATGYAVTPANGTNALMDLIAGKEDSLAATFAPYPVLTVNTTAFVNSTTDLSADSIHPNNQGHRHIFDAIKARLGGSNSFQDAEVFFANGHLRLTYGNQIRQLIDQTPIYKDGQFAPDTLRFGSSNAQKVGIISNGIVVATFDQTGTNGLEMTKSIRTGDAALAAGEIQMKSTISGVAGTIGGIGRIGGRVGFYLNKDQFGGDPDNNVWTQNISGGSYNFQTISDNLSTGNTFISLYRSGTTADSVSIMAAWTNIHGKIKLFGIEAAAPTATVLMHAADSSVRQMTIADLGQTILEADGSYTTTLMTTNNTPSVITPTLTTSGQSSSIEINVTAVLNDGDGSYHSKKYRGYLKSSGGTCTGDASETDIKSNYLGSGLSTAAATLTISSNNPTITITGESGKTIYWTVKQHLTKTPAPL